MFLNCEKSAVALPGLISQVEPLCNAYIVIHNYTLLKILFIGLTLEYSILYSVHRHDLQTDSFHCADFLSPRHRNTDIRCCFVSQIPGGKLNPESWRSMLNTTTIQK